jgi:pimeloyl-ACP methyl ester carboxylesterase
MGMHRGRLILGVLAVLPIAILGPYVALDREARALDAPTRQALGGTYVTLPSGVTHYELAGPEDGPVVVLVHGGTIPSFAWDAQIPALLEAGFRVLRYDHFGRGYSDRPEVDYDRACYQKQLEDLLMALGIEGPVHLVGVSFGGPIAATFARAHPERVAKLVFIAPVVDYAEGKALFQLAQVPILSEWYARVFSVRGTVARANGFFEESGADPSYAKRFDEQTRFNGYEQALLSMSRTNALTSYRDTYAALGDQPKLLLWGADDPEIPRGHIEFLRDNVSRVTFVEIEGAGHGLNVQRKEEVNRQLVSFLIEQ